MILEQTIYAEIVVDSFLNEVWEAWTTESGVKTFFAPDCKIDLRPGGAYEMYFAPDAPIGLRGGEGCKILAIQPTEMLSFTWNAPPSIPEIRGQFTHVVVRLEHDYAGTKIILTHDGWGMSEYWLQAFSYFLSAWNKVVLPRLQYRFCVKPIDWSDPPKLNF